MGEIGMNNNTKFIKRRYAVRRLQRLGRLSAFL